MATVPQRREVLPAPETLGLATRENFRAEANARLDAMPPGEGVLLIDFSRTAQIDSSGLNALVLIERHAAERRLQVVLRNLAPEIRYLLTLTHLESLFVFETDPR